jgi:thioredoxin 1
MSLDHPSSAPPGLVVCLCAAWCGVCGDYRARFTQVQAKFPQMEFLWIDIEDEADLLHPLDVEDFPTLLLAVGNEPRFFGPLTPQLEMLERLVRAQIQDAGVPALTDPAVVALLGRIRASR